MSREQCEKRWGCDICGKCGEYYYDCDCEEPMKYGFGMLADLTETKSKIQGELQAAKNFVHIAQQMCDSPDFDLDGLKGLLSSAMDSLSKVAGD